MADLSKELNKELNKDFAYCEDALGRAENAIGNLPSAQPEKRTEKRMETHACDLISRQAAIDALHMHLMYRMGTDSNKKRLDDWINGLPSAQETHEERTETHACDLISRRAAIDYVDDVPYIKDHPNIALLLKAWVEQLPSAQPETAKRIVGKSRDGMTLWYQCDMCNEPVDVQDNFCSGCGRRLVNE